MDMDSHIVVILDYHIEGMEGMAVFGIGTMVALDTPFTCTTWTLAPGGHAVTKIHRCVWLN